MRERNPQLLAALAMPLDGSNTKPRKSAPGYVPLLGCVPKPINILLKFAAVLVGLADGVSRTHRKATEPPVPTTKPLVEVMKP